MAKSNTNSKKGFTIIEVVLVLAIAGLIFLMVFIALPALQRSQRDTQRRDDMARVATAINQFQTNNGGKLPNQTNPETTGERFIEKYLKADGEGDFVDPSGEDYTVVFTDEVEDGEAQNTLKADAEPGFQVTVYTNASCNGETAIKSPNKRDYAIVYKLEGSGVYCSDSQ
jgi:prepilin-type N-terminal cleavage/methylation domain-containing protein